MRIEGGLKGYSAGNNKTPIKMIVSIKLVTRKKWKKDKFKRFVILP